MRKSSAWSAWRAYHVFLILRHDWWLCAVSAEWGVADDERLLLLLLFRLLKLGDGDGDGPDVK